MSVAKMLLFEEWDTTAEPTLEEQFEEALAREEDRDRRQDAQITARRRQIRLVVDNGRR